MTEAMIALLAQVHERHPLVHSITNYVTMKTTANALLAFGAAPVMAHALEEVEEMAQQSGALVLNIGTLSESWTAAMFKAGAAARAAKVPIVLDPVGAGATHLRTNTSLRLLAEVRPQVVRGNASEIMALAGDGGARGVDARHGVGEAEVAAREVAARSGAVVAVTGADDFICDGGSGRTAWVRNGHPLMARITGSGCAVTALVAACCAVEPDHFRATVTALCLFGLAGEAAAEEAAGPGSFEMRLYDALDALDQAQIRRSARVELGS